MGAMLVAVGGIGPLVREFLNALWISTSRSLDPTSLTSVLRDGMPTLTAPYFSASDISVTALSVLVWGGGSPPPPPSFARITDIRPFFFFCGLDFCLTAPRVRPHKFSPTRVFVSRLDFLLARPRR